MKTLYSFVIAFILLNSLTYSQSLAPIGAKWHYTERFAFSGDISFFYFEVVSDTFFSGKNCIKIFKNNDLECSERNNNYDFMYESNDTVYIFDSLQNRFQIMYDFNANVGDSWTYILNDWNDTDTAQIYVDSTDFILINGHTRKRLFLRAEINFENQGITPQYFTAIQSIGSPKFFFPLDGEITASCDANWTTGLRCYEDSIIGQYRLDTIYDCDYTYVWNSITEIEENNTIQVYPNPVVNSLFVNTDTPFDYEIISIEGRPVMNGHSDKNEIDISELSNSIYIIRIFKPNQSYQSTKFLKIK